MGSLSQKAMAINMMLHTQLDIISWSHCESTWHLSHSVRAENPEEPHFTIDVGQFLVACYQEDFQLETFGNQTIRIFIVACAVRTENAWIPWHLRRVRYVSLGWLEDGLSCSIQFWKQPGRPVRTESPLSIPHLITEFSNSIQAPDTILNLSRSTAGERGNTSTPFPSRHSSGTLVPSGIISWQRTDAACGDHHGIGSSFLDRAESRENIRVEVSVNTTRVSLCLWQVGVTTIYPCDEDEASLEDIHIDHIICAKNFPESSQHLI